MSSFLLTCPATFNETLSCREPQIVSEVSKLYEAYTLHQWCDSVEDAKCLHMKSYGLSCMGIVFCNVLAKTKNLGAAVYHAKKAYLYYAEFISQISQDSNSFLKLTPTDGVLFSYKKTVFSIDTALAHPSTAEEEKIYGLLFCLTHIIRDFILTVEEKAIGADIGEFVTMIGQPLICDKKWSMSQLLILTSQVRLYLQAAETENECHEIMSNIISSQISK